MIAMSSMIYIECFIGATTPRPKNIDADALRPSRSLTRHHYHPAQLVVFPVAWCRMPSAGVGVQVADVAKAWSVREEFPG